MAFRGTNSTATGDAEVRMLRDLQQRVRRLEEARNPLPDPGWVLIESDDGLHYLFVPSGSQGPVIGTR